MSFDLKTHIVNKRGQLVATQHYRLKIENGVRKFERPPGSGDWFFENGQPVQGEAKVEAPVEAKPAVKAEVKAK